MMRLRSSSRWSRNPMVGISSLAVGFTEVAVASGIGRYFRNRSRFLDGVDSDGGWFSGSNVGLRRFGRSQFLWGRRIEDAAGQRTERCLKRRQNLLHGFAAGVE